MALVVGVNSWVTVAEADTYFNTRVGSAAWFALAETSVEGAPSKESWLVSAYYWLIDDSFALVPSTTASDYVKRAQYESTLFLLENSDEYNNRETLIATGVEDFKNSKWEETLNRVNKPQRVLDILNAGGASFNNVLVDLESETCT